MRCRSAFFALICVVAQAAQGAPPINKLQSRQWPEHVVTQRILSQFATVLRLQKADFSGRPPPRLPLSEVWYSTQPYSTGIAGLCQTDIVTFQFHPIGRAHGARTPTVVRGITSHPGYHLAAPPPQFQPTYVDASLPQADADCAKLDPEKDMRISADEAENAWKAAWLIGEVKRLTQQQIVTRPDCSDPKQANCLPVVPGLDVGNIYFAEACRNPEPNGECMTVFLNGKFGPQTSLRILFIITNDGAKIVRWTAGELVTVADERAD